MLNAHPLILQQIYRPSVSVFLRLFLFPSSRRDYPVELVDSFLANMDLESSGFPWRCHRNIHLVEKSTVTVSDFGFALKHQLAHRYTLQLYARARREYG